MSITQNENRDPNPNLQQIEAALSELSQSNPPPQVLAVYQTISQQAHQMAEELNMLQEELQAAKQDRAKFVSVVTHELRIPLTSIKGYTDLLRQEIVGLVNDQQKNFLNVVRENVDRMSALISDLADMSYLQTGRLKLQPKPVKIGDLSAELLHSWQARLDEKKQHITLAMDPALPEVMLDPARFNQVLGNLVSNAYRYTPADGQITVRATKDGNTLRVEVQDNGIGISPEDQAHLFTPFFRSEDSAVRASPGWGIALYVTRLLVELMGGQIGVSSQLGQGSTFWLCLPLDESAS